MNHTNKPEQMIDSSAFCTLGGTRHHGSPSSWRRAEREDLEERFRRLRFHRDLLLAACGGCENTLLFLCRIVPGQDSYEEFAAALGKCRGTAWRIVQGFLEEIGNTLRLAGAAHASAERGEPGITLNPHTAQAVVKNVWAVSLAGHERRFLPHPTLSQIALYVAEHRQVLFGREKLYLGGWIDDDDGHYCLDITRLFPSDAVARAKRFGKRNDQKAITNLLTLKSLPVKKVDREAA